MATHGGSLWIKVGTLEGEGRQNFLIVQIGGRAIQNQGLCGGGGRSEAREPGFGA